MIPTLLPYAQHSSQGKAGKLSEEHFTKPVVHVILSLSTYLLADGLPPGAAEVELAGADRLVEPVRK